MSSTSSPEKEYNDNKPSKHRQFQIDHSKVKVKFNEKQKSHEKEDASDSDDDQPSNTFSKLDNTDNEDSDIDDKHDKHDNRDNRDNRDNKEDKNEGKSENDRQNETRDKRNERNERNERDESEEQEEEEEDLPRRKSNTDSLANLDKFLYKKNMQLLKIFKMDNRCIFLIVLLKKIGKCVVVYIDPSRFKVECQINNSIIERENIHDISLFKIGHRHIYEVCDCFPELIKQVKDDKIDMEVHKRKTQLMHFDQVCVHLNKFKDVVKKSNCKLGILTTSGIGFINNENDIELFTLSGQNPDRFSRLKIYLTYDLEDFTSNIDSVSYEVNELYPQFIDELSKEFEISESSLKSNRTLNNLDGIKRLLQKLKEKQEHLHQDSQELAGIFKEIKKRKKEMKAKPDNVQQRFKIENLEKTEEGATFFKMEVEDEHSNLLAHCLNIMHIINKQCNNINEYLEFIKQYCKL